jgi:hypothetical protein
MPTALRAGPYRFFFYAGDGGEPPHIHVERDDCEAKYWLTPVAMARNRGFARKELREIRSIVRDHLEELLDTWNGFFHG